MPCYRLVPAYQTEDGSIVFSERGRIRRPLFLPCGQCIGCRLDRSRSWAVRCMHEASLHKQGNSFITLTYSDEFYHPSLRYRDFQLFLKRAREKLKTRVRYFAAGEYGEEFSRPHFHAILFGVDFSDRRYFKRSESGKPVYTSSTLESLWKFGFSSIGDVTFESAAYVARYCCKKVTGAAASDHYKYVDSDTGEICRREPEQARMSLKPGIGADWFKKYKSDVFPRDFVVINGEKIKPPKYYYQLLQAETSLMSDEVEYSRYLKSLRLAAESTDERLSVREKVATARAGLLKRKLQ